MFVGNNFISFSVSCDVQSILKYLFLNLSLSLSLFSNKLFPVFTIWTGIVPKFDYAFRNSKVPIFLMGSHEQISQNMMIMSWDV